MAERRTLSRNNQEVNKKSPEKKNKKVKIKSNTEMPVNKKLNPAVGELWAVITAAFGILLALSIYFDGIVGLLGKFLKDFLLGMFGFPAYLFPLFLIFFSIFYIAKKTLIKKSAWISFGIFVVIASIIQLFIGSESFSIKSLYLDKMGGGIIGGIIVFALSFSGKAGSATVLITALIVMIIIVTEFSFAELMNEVKEKRKQKDIEVKDEIKSNHAINKQDKNKGAIKTVINEAEELPEFEIHTHDQVAITAAVPHDESITAQGLMKNELENNSANIKEVIKKDDASFVPVSEEEISREIERKKTQVEYRFPPISLLKVHTPEKNTKDKPENLRENAKKLIDTLKSFGVDAKILEVSKGPAVTRYEIQPSPGVKVSKIVNLADDIALNLAAYGVRIEAPIPGKAAVGIEVPNQSVSTVYLREVIGSKEFVDFKSKTAVALGKDILGNPIIADISKMPHILIAGTTGSGKSVCINTLIASIIYKASPEEVKLLMIDPKVVELGVYNGIPHLMIPVVTDPRKAAGALNWAVTEMTKRYKIFADCNVRDIRGYNEYAESEGIAKLEHIVIIIDELSDLMMLVPREVEDSICRLAQMARAAGMHLVIATQRPSVDVITGLIKANIPSRIAFTVSNSIDSRTILDMMGAEKLLGRGDMLFLPVGASKPKRIQGAFISDKEVEKIVDFIKGDYEPEYDADIMEHLENIDNPNKDNNGKNGEEGDEFLNQAIETVIDCGQASVSMIQRKFKVGYARAGRIIDQMETRGIIGPHEGSKPRQVIMTKTQFYEMTMNTNSNETQE